MAEVLGVIASVATIAGLARPTAIFVRTLKGIVQDDDPIAKEILRVASHIEFSFTTIEIAIEQLKGHCSTIKILKNVTSKVLKLIHKRKLADILHRDAKAIKQQLKDATKYLDSMQRGPRIIKHIKWYLYNKMGVESLLPSLDYLNHNLMLLNPTLNFEIKQYFHERSEAEVARGMGVEIESLRSQLEKAEKLLQNTLDSQNVPANHGTSLGTEFRDFGKLLLRLSKSMRQTETISEDKGISPPGGSHTSREPFLRVPSELSTHVHESEISEEIPSVHRKETRHQEARSRSSRPYLSPRTPQAFTTIHVPSTHSSSYVRKHRDLEVPGDSQSDASGQTSRSRESRSFLSSPSTSEPQTPDTPQTPHTLRELEIPKPLKISTSPSTTERGGDIDGAISGYLTNTGSNQKAVFLNGVVDTRFSDNYISIKLATKLGLDIMELESKYPLHTHTVGGKSSREIIGKVSDVRWQRKRWSKPIMLDFWVKEFYLDVGEQLVFGNDFIQALERSNQAVW